MTKAPLLKGIGVPAAGRAGVGAAGLAALGVGAGRAWG